MSVYVAVGATIVWMVAVWLYSCLNDDDVVKRDVSNGLLLAGPAPVLIYYALTTHGAVVSTLALINVGIVLCFLRECYTDNRRADMNDPYGFDSVEEKRQFHALLRGLHVTAAPGTKMVVSQDGVSIAHGPAALVRRVNDGEIAYDEATDRYYEVA